MNGQLRRVVVTGIGVVSPVGNTLDETWNNLVNGVNGIAPITLFDATDYKAKVAGEVKNFEPGFKQYAGWDDEQCDFPGNGHLRYADFLHW